MLSVSTIIVLFPRRWSQVKTNIKGKTWRRIREAKCTQMCVCVCSRVCARVSGFQRCLFDGDDSLKCCPSTTRSVQNTLGCKRRVSCLEVNEVTGVSLHRDLVSSGVWKPTVNHVCSKFVLLWHVWGPRFSAGEFVELAVSEGFSPRELL